MPYSKAVVTIAAFALLAVGQIGTVDDYGLERTETAFKRALVTFGLVRTLNGLISVAQGTELALEPAGVGLTFAPGEILDPVNDLVERFSLILLASATSLGMQRVLIDITASTGFTLCLSVMVIAALVLLWVPRAAHTVWRNYAVRAALALAMLRFAVPSMAIVNESIYQLHLAPEFRTASEQLVTTSTTLQDLNEGLPSGATPDPSLLESAREALRRVGEQFDVSARIDALTETADEISEHAVRLIVVFLVHTVLLPLVFLWLLLKLLGWVFQSDWRAPDATTTGTPSV